MTTGGYLGTPGGPHTFAFMADEGFDHTETIIYSTGLVEAIAMYEAQYETQPYSIRYMADNE